MESIDIEASPIQRTFDSQGELDLAEIGQALWRRRRTILSFTLLSAILAVLVSFLLPKVYASNATILPKPRQDGVSGIVAGMSAQLGTAASLLGGLTSDNSDILVDILSSRSMAERVIVKCHLDSQLFGWKSHRDLVVRLQKMTAIKPPGAKSKTIDIQVRAPKGELAASIANAYVEELKRMLNEIGYNQASGHRKFLENKLQTNKRELQTAEDRLADFQTKNQIASLPDTVVASIKSLSDLEAQQIAAEASLKAAGEVLEGVRAKVENLQADPNSLTDLELKRTELAARNRALVQAQDSFREKLSELPPKGVQFARLQRDVQVKNAIYLVLMQQYESALISENKESEAFMVLDRAEVPESPSNPSKKLIAILGMLMGLTISTLGVLLQSRFGQFSRQTAGT